MFAAGERVQVRDACWRVRSHRRISDSTTLLELDPIGDARSSSLTICVPPDEILRLPSETPTLAANTIESFSVWARLHGLLASTIVRGPDHLSGAVTGRVQIEAYQLAPTLRLLRKPRPSLLVADDVGLGKTVEAGLAMLELAARRRADRILVVAPPGLLNQWQRELLGKFGLDFVRIENAAGLAREQTALPAGVSPWESLPRVLTSVDYLKKETVRKRALRKRWDLIVADEAHYLAEAGTNSNPYRTQRTRLGTALRDASRGLLLLTATPHNGHSHSFRSLLELVEPTLATFRGAAQDRVRRVEGARIRRLKAQITRRLADCSEQPVFPEREVKGIAIRPGDRWQELFLKVSSYCSRTARSAHDTDDDELVTFAMQIVKKRALSSRAALEKTIANRLEALRKKEAEARPERAEIREFQADLPMSEAAAERTAGRILRAAVPREEKLRKSEVSALNGIKKLLKGLPAGDPKIDALLVEIHSVLQADPQARFIVFTEYLDTLAALREAFDADPQLKERVVEIKGGMSARQRDKVQERFEQPGIHVLLATDAASEGLNLQRACHRVIHFELPWNPNRLEQRNGRVDRYGQERPPRIRYLFYPDSPEEDVLSRLIERIQAMQKDRISTPDILGVLAGTDLFDRSLVELDGTCADVETRKGSLVRMFEDRTAEFVRDVQPLVAAQGDLSGEIATILEHLNQAHPLLKDDDGLESLVVGLLGSTHAKSTDEDGVFRIAVPPRFSGPRVAPVYPRATFRRSVAIRHKSEEVDFITRAHPLVLAIADQARRRFLFVYPDERGLPARRVTVRRAPPGLPASAVFTFLAEASGTGGLVLEELLATQVDLAGAVLAVGGEALRWLDPTAVPGEVPQPVVEQLYRPHFDAMTASASRQVEQDWKARVAELRKAREVRAEAFRMELERDLTDRLAEIDEEDRRARKLIEQGGQGLLFGKGSSPTQSFEHRREAARSFAEGRRVEIDAFATLKDPSAPRALGVLLLVPEGAR